MAREITIMTPEQVELKFELAGIGSRCVAMIVDTLIQAAIVLVFFIATLGLGGLSGLGLDNAISSVWFAVVCVLVLFLMLGGYFLYFEAAKNGQTPGKKCAKIRVVRDTGHPIDFRSALLRNVIRLVDCLPGAYGVAIVSVFFSPEYRRLGDYVAGTLVVKVGREPDAVQHPVAYPEQPAQTSPGVPAASAALSVADQLPPEAMLLVSSIQKDEYRAIRHFLDRRVELSSDVVANLSTKLAVPVAAKLRIDMSSVDDPVAFLSAVSSEWERRAIH